MSSSNPQRASTSGATPGSAAFSYAQAAKGRSTSVPSATAPGQGGDSTSNDSTNATPAEELSASTKDTSVSGSSNHSVSGQEHRRPTGVEEMTSKPNAPPDSRAKGATASPSPPGPAQPTASASASPNLNARAAPVQPKDDDAPSAANVPSDSTWDRQSQWSNSVSEAGDQVAGDRSRGKRQEESNERSATLIAAPVPAVNVWQQRKEAQAAKAKSVYPELRVRHATLTWFLIRRPGGPVHERSGETPAAEGAKHVGMMDESQSAALTNGSGRDKAKNSGTERPREEGECP
jgi:la-related protein 1